MEVTITDNVGEVKSLKSELVEKALEAVGLEAVARVVPLVPVDTGRLRNSITFEVDKDSVAVGTNVEYAESVEFNEKANHPRGGQAHYLRDGITRNLDVYKNIIKRVLGE